MLVLPVFRILSSGNSSASGAISTTSSGPSRSVIVFGSRSDSISVISAYTSGLITEAMFISFPASGTATIHYAAAVGAIVTRGGPALTALGVSGSANVIVLGSEGLTISGADTFIL